MKTVYKFLMFGAMALALTVVNVTASFAQDDAAAQEAKTALYTKFTDCYTKRKNLPPADLDACYAVGKDYLDKYEKDNDQYSQFVRKVYDAYVKVKAADALANRFNNSVKDSKAINADEAFSSGKEFIDQNPDAVDVPIVLASIGFDNASAATPNDKYNADAINYAKMTIDRINAGKVSPNGQYGAYQYAYKTTKYPDGKNNALGWMNYTIGYIMFYRQNQKKDALPYLYKATQINSETKNNFRIYATIGSWYADEFKRIDADRIAKVKAASDQDTEETKSLYALQKGYAERAADTYARAAKLASTDTSATKEQKDGLLTLAKQFYGIRYNNDPTKFDGFDTYYAGLTNKPLVDPTTAVTPVVEQTPAATTPGAATTSTPVTTATPSTTTTAKPTPPTPSTTTTTTTKPSTTSTPPKKKGTR
ncbi:MAG: hypothetical protein ACR2N3_07555 [Pyrinomonadaceae bacterium]